MSFTLLSQFISSKTLFISPSGLQIDISSDQVNLLGRDCTNDHISNLCALNFELIVYHADAFCIKAIDPGIFTSSSNLILLLGDTHHGPNPVSSVIDWIASSPVKRVINYSCPHHDELFTYFTGIECTYFPIVFGAKYWHAPIHTVDHSVIHIGNLSEQHQRRQFVIRSLQRSNANISLLKLFGLNMTKAINSSLASLNCSLNCDISHRISESLAAGTFLYTDRLTKYQKILSFLDAEGLVFLYDIDNINALNESINALADKYSSQAGKISIFKDKQIIHQKFINIIKGFDLYALAASYIMGRDVILPEILEPETSFFENKLSREVLSFYEIYQERHRKRSYNDERFKLSKSDYVNYKLLCSRLSG